MPIFELIALFAAFSSAHSQLRLPSPLPPLPCNPIPVALGSLIPAAKIDYSSLTASGFSSGASMATQLMFALSEEFQGAGMFATVPYGTFMNNTLDNPPGFVQFLTKAPLFEIPIVTTSNADLEAQADWFAQQQLIPSTTNIAGKPVYVFSGKVDVLVNNLYGHRTADMFNHYGANVKAILTMNATHTVPTNNYPTPVNDCPLFDYVSDCINNCNYEGIFDMFSHLYGENYIQPSSSTAATTGTYSSFLQDPYTATGNSANDFMDTHGFLYVPQYCKDPTHTCKIHVALHGCTQSIYNDVCNLFARNLGYWQVADANNVVIVFPQSARVEFDSEGDANFSCWDFFGGTTAGFCFPTAPQIASIRNITRAFVKQLLA